MPIGSRPRRRRLSIQLEPKPPVSSMKQASACQSSHLRATSPAPCVPSMLRTLIGGKATSPWRGKITLRIVAEARHVDAEDARLLGDVLGAPGALGRLGAFVGPDQRVERGGREAAEHVDQHPRIVAPVLLDLLARPLRRDAGRAPGVVGIAGDLGEVPQPPLAGEGAVQRAFEMRRVAGLHDVAFDARGERGLGRRHHRVGDAAAIRRA